MSVLSSSVGLCIPAGGGVLAWAIPLWGIVAAVCALIGVIFAGHLLARWLLVRLVLGKAEVIIQPQRVRLGEVLNVRYRQSAKRQVHVEQVLLTLICREWVEYTRGTKTYHDRHEVLNEPYPVLEEHDLPRGHELGGEASMPVSATAMHSFHSKHNRVEWVVRCRVRIPRYPDYTREWPIDVLPLLAPPAEQEGST